jgi:hypothetical protein
MAWIERRYWFRDSHFVAPALAILLALVIMAGAFFLGRETGKGPAAEAALDDPPATTLEPGGTIPHIDTSTPDWDRQYWEEWRAKPRYDRVVNGIAVGPTVDDRMSSSVCGPDAPPTDAELSDARGTPLEISPRYLPAGAEVANPEPAVSVRCGDQIAVAGLTVGIRSAPDAEERIAKGESWFVVPHGGSIIVHKWRLRPGAVPEVQSFAPAEHWFEMTIGGLPAAVNRPIFDAGLGFADAVVWDERLGVLTVVHSFNVSLAELVKFTEGVVP